MRFSWKCSVEFSEASLAFVGSRLGSVVGATLGEFVVDQSGTAGELLEESVGKVVISIDSGGARDEVAGVVGEVEGRLRLESGDEGLPVVGVVLMTVVLVRTVRHR